VSLKEALYLKNEALKAKLSKARRTKALPQSVASKRCINALHQSVASKRRVKASFKASRQSVDALSKEKSKKRG
jgi:hypothetical protein